MSQSKLVGTMSLRHNRSEMECGIAQFSEGEEGLGVDPDPLHQFLNYAS